MKINYILAGLAIVGGLSAAFTNYSERNHFYPTWKYDQERINGNRIHFVSATQLADLLYKKVPEVFVLDTRNEKAYQAYHIPQAVRYDIADKKTFENNKDAMVFLYGSDLDHQYYNITKELSGDIYVLKGGIEEWFSVVLFPDFKEFHIRNNDKLEEIIRRCRYFGGSPGNTQFLNIEIRESRYREGC